MLRRDVTKECAHTVSMCKVDKQLKTRPRGAAWSASQQDPVGLRPTRGLRVLCAHHGPRRGDLEVGFFDSAALRTPIRASRAR